MLQHAIKWPHRPEHVALLSDVLCSLWGRLFVEAHLSKHVEHAQTHLRISTSSFVVTSVVYCGDKDQIVICDITATCNVIFYIFCWEQFLHRTVTIVVNQVSANRLLAVICCFFTENTEIVYKASVLCSHVMHQSHYPSSLTQAYRHFMSNSSSAHRYGNTSLSLWLLLHATIFRTKYLIQRHIY